jgi:hypothetical protein
VINDGLADAVLYVGQYGSVLRSAVTVALCRFLDGTYSNERCEDAKPPPSSVAFISHSLGSVMLFDSIEDLARLGSSIQVNAAISRTRLFLMFANQRPLLELSASAPVEMEPLITSSSGLGGRLDRFLERIGPAIDLAASPREPLHVIAFTDPSDLLSYKLQQSDVRNARYSNVL